MGSVYARGLSRSRSISAIQGLGERSRFKMSDVSSVNAPSPAGATSLRHERIACGLSGRAWGRIAVMVGLMGAVFWPNLRRLWLKTNPISGEPNWGHSIFVPLIGLYYLYINREDLTRPRGRPVSRGRAAVGVWVQLQLVAIGVLCVAWAYFPMGIEGAARRWVIGAMGIWAALTAAIVGGEGEIADWLMRASSSWFGGYLMGWGIWFYAWGIRRGKNETPPPIRYPPNHELDA